jgi:hypothetical protein
MRIWPGIKWGSARQSAYRQAGESPGKTISIRKFRTFLVGLAAFALVSGGAPAANAAYTYIHTDYYNFYSSNNAVHANGHVNWYKDPRSIIEPAIFRGEYSGWVQLQVAGCLYAKVTWYTVTGSVSWPPAGSVGSTSDGWYRRCGYAGAWIDLTGQAHASSTLLRTCLSVGFSGNINMPRSYQANHCMWN